MANTQAMCCNTNWIFKCKFQPIYNITPPATQDLLAIFSASEASDYEINILEISDSLSTKTYIGNMCKRCGHFVKAGE